MTATIAPPTTPTGPRAIAGLAAAMRAEADRAGDSTGPAANVWHAAAGMVELHAGRIRDAALLLLDVLAVADAALRNAGVDQEETRIRLAETVNTLSGLLVGDIPAHLAPAPAPVDINPGLLADMQVIAQQFRGLAYDPDDRPEEVAAVIAAAKAAGLVPVPSRDITPRSYRGCTPPETAPTAARARFVGGRPVDAPSAVDDVLAAMIAHLAPQMRQYLASLYGAGQRATGRVDG